MEREEELIRYYTEKMLERYNESTRRPEVIRAIELLQRADNETIWRVLEMLENK